MMHTPRNPFQEEGALEVFEDGALLVKGGRVAALGDYDAVSREHPEVAVTDLRPGILLPGFVDTHVHYPQVYSLGAMGLPLLSWLRERILPAELAFAEPAFARQAAADFILSLLMNGTTSALVFGVHVVAAQGALFEAAERRGLRVISGLITSDRNLLSEMHRSPAEAQRDSRALIARWHGRGGLRYALTPRFAISSSPRMLAALGELLEETPDLYVQTHLNETIEEIAFVRELFPEARDYLSVYQAHGLLGRRSVFAHNLHATGSELARLADHESSVAHCPSSNFFLGSGLFGLRAHLRRGVKVALGSDVGAGTGFSLFKEGLQAYQGQMLQEGYPLGPDRLLYLVTAAGAAALDLEGEIGDLRVGKAADLVLVRAPQGSTLERALAHAQSAREALGVLFTLAREESVARVYIAGEPAYSRDG
jgi:guanine deaminase